MDTNKWNALSNFFQKIESAKNSLNLRSHQDCFYRGHSKSSYKLLPSLFRQGNLSDEEYWKLERRIFFEFRIQARQLYKEQHSDWDVLFHMQHHGVPTRLLDWTSVLGVALYFSILDYNENEGQNEPPCIWLLNPYSLNKSNWGLARLFNTKYLTMDDNENRSYEYGEVLLGTIPQEWEDKNIRLSWNKPMAIVDNQKSDRMFAQSGWFTIQGTDNRPMEDQLAMEDNVLKKIEIDVALIPVIKTFLEFSGIGHRQLFPDLDGLSKSVCEKFGIKRK